MTEVGGLRATTLTNSDIALDLDRPSIATLARGKRASLPKALPVRLVDPFGNAHDVPNLHIVDGSNFVTSAGR